jgi:hypothetical protein
MSDVLCRVCGEPWDTHHLRHDAPAWVNALVLAGAGCESCEGQAPEGSDPESIALESDTRYVIDPPTDGDPLEERPAVAGDKPPAWERPPDQLAWQCTECDVRIVRDSDEREGHESAYRVEGCTNYYAQRDLQITHGNDSAGDLETLRDQISQDGQACRLCRESCDGGCGCMVDKASAFPDPRDEYAKRYFCEDCYSREESDAAIESFSAYDLIQALGYDRRSGVGSWIDSHNVTLDQVDASGIQVESEGTSLTYRKPQGRKAMAIVLWALRKAVLS